MLTDPLNSQLTKNNEAKSLLKELIRLHNYLYANEGLSKEVIFKDISKILAIKLYTERKNFKLFSIGAGQNAKEKLEQFYVIANELSQDLKIPELSSFTLSPRALITALEVFDNFRLTDLKTDFLSDAYQTFFAHYHRGARGEFHTPYPVVKLAVKLAKPKLSERLIDPAAGAGGFLVAATRALNTDRDKEAGLEHSIKNYIQNMLYAVEINPDIAFFLRIRFFIEFGLAPRVINDNGLVFALEKEESFDIVITNPPFGARGKVDNPLILKHYELAREWKKASGKWTSNEQIKPRPPEVLFLEASIKLLKPGGRLVVVIPDGILQNNQAEYIRFWLGQRTRLRAVISLPNVTFAPYGTGVKTSLLMLEKKPPQEAPEAKRKVFFAISSNVGYDRRGNPIPNSDLEEIAEAFEKLTQAQVREGAVRVDQKATCFLVEANAIGNRWDAEYYSPKKIRIKQENGEPLLLTTHRAEDFCVRNLGEVAVFKEEKLPRRELDPDTEVRYIEISSILPGIPLIGRPEVMRIKDLPSRASYIVNAGDILLAIAGGSTGTQKQAVAWVTEEYNGAVCTNGFAVLTPLSEVVNPFFLLSYFYSEAFLEELRRVLKGHAIPAASPKDVKSIPIYLPPRPTQDLIGKQMQDALESIEKGLKQLKDVKKAVNSLH